MVAQIVDLEASKAGSKLVAGAARHICVKEGVEPHLDQLRHTYVELPALLQQYAEAERRRLEALATMHKMGDSVDELTIVYACAACRHRQRMLPWIRPSSLRSSDVRATRVLPSGHRVRASPVSIRTHCTASVSMRVARAV